MVMVSRALSGPYRIDRANPPSAFYTPKAPTKNGLRPGLDVFARSGDHERRTHIIVGIVAEQTPFGQGTSYEFRRRDLRLATPDEVRAALQREHPKRSAWRPESPEIRNLSALVTGGISSDEGLTRLFRRNKAEARRTLADYRQTYLGIRRRWHTIVRQQTTAVLAQLKE